MITWYNNDSINGDNIMFDLFYFGIGICVCIIGLFLFIQLLSNKRGNTR